MIFPRAFRRLMVIGAALSRLSAQVAPPASPPPAGDQGQPVVHLSLFEVSSDAVRGYATTSSTSTSRIAVPITELPSSLITINEQLIADTLAVTPEEVLKLVGGMSAFNDTGQQEGNTFALRGYTPTGAQRDGFDDLLFDANGGAVISSACGWKICSMT